ncbi:glycine cleavage system aminomethyltransferase GcvT [Botrimarina hoheduenensis]|uniref:Aminomethyltransferase n=1 Tax=Botrimarina hoheduenensis TaxID=2528000 RepID=A0A5C5VWV2_9BACT|nr:glycine cleavage system aminomethyltransferase GcvT [Botrimarina hoheduenensis]TWT42485.1 Glycine cleavage system T protein [Botrimarina hoheduenensis]
MASTAQSVDLLRTPLADWHAAHGGRLVDFAGWAMPVQYGSIVEEHVATRTGVGLFDVSHMGRLAVRGSQAGPFLDHVLTRRVTALKPGQIRYSLVCNSAGGMLDDVLAGRVGVDSAEGPAFALVVNASNREKLNTWFAEEAQHFQVSLDDQTLATAMIAVQGPRAVAMVAQLADTDVAALRYYSGCEARVAGVPCAVSRTGYTGEDGFELTCPAQEATALWQALCAAGGVACGLAARDTLRLEAGMPLYGHELSEQLNPLDAGLRFAVDLCDSGGQPRSFVGGDALRSADSSGPQRLRVGLAIEGKRPPREQYRVLTAGRACGVVTSGTHSPTLGKPIAMAYVEPPYATEGTSLTVDIRGTETPATVVPLPFYRRS